MRWNWSSKTLMGIYTNYKQDEKSCLRSHKTAKNIVISLQKICLPREKPVVPLNCAHLSCRIGHILYKLNNENQKKTIIMKFNAIIFVRLEQWNFSLPNYNCFFFFERRKVVFQSLHNLGVFSIPITGVAKFEYLNFLKCPQVSVILLRILSRGE